MTKNLKPSRIAWQHRLTVQLAALVLLFTVLPQAVIIAFNYTSIRAQTLQTAHQDSLLHAESTANQITLHINSRVALLQSMADTPSLRANDWKTARHELERLQVRYTDLSRLTLVDTEGNPQVQVSMTGEVLPFLSCPSPDFDCFLDVMNGDVYLGDFLFLTGSGQHLLVSVPIFNDSRQEVIGVLEAQLSLSNLLDDHVVSPIEKNSYVYLVDAQGQIIAHPDFSLVLAQTNAQSIPEVNDFLSGMSESEELEMSGYENFSGEFVLGIHATVPVLGWGIIAEQPESEVFSLITSQIQISGIILGLNILISILLAMGLANLVANPIGELTRAAQHIAAGDRKSRVPIGNRENEVGKLALAFNQMAENVQEAEDKLQKSEIKFKTLVTNNEEIVFMIAEDGTFLLSEGKGLAALGLKPGEVVGESVLELYQDYPDMLDEMRKVFKGETIACEVNIGGIYFRNWYTPHKNHIGEIIGLLGLSVNITERVQAEEEKRQMEAHLRQQQKLESIGTLASGIAHEINNPITGVMNYAQLIGQRLEPEQEQLREYAGEIRHETERVAEIVRNLLAFAREEKKTHNPARMADILNDTLSLIRTIIKRDQITLEVNLPDDLPTIKCRSQQIQQVLMNLLTNARDALNQRYPKYDADKIVTVTVYPFEEDGRKWLRTTVEDHGVGIPAEIRERIFDPFYTSKDRALSTGLGLSISLGIIQDHHGKLTFESEEGKGTRFFLDLPVDNSWEI